MADFESPADFDDELLSAYLDDELSAEERARVEERLQVDPAAAQLLEELRVVSGAVRALPREKLSGDLRADVLAGVERGGAEDDAEPHIVTLPYDRVDRWTGVRRGLMWSAMAIAATLLLVALQPEDEDGPVADRAVQRERNAQSGDEVPAFRAPPVDDEITAEAQGGRGGGVADAKVGRAEAPEEGQVAEAVRDGAPEDKQNLAEPSQDQFVDQSAPAPAAEPSGSAASELESRPASGAPSSRAGAVSGAQTFAGGEGGNRPSTTVDGAKNESELASRRELQVVELTLGEAGAAEAKEFERVLAENSIALNEEALTPDSSEDDATAESLTAGNAILVEATPAQLKQILTAYQGRAVAVGQEKMPEELSRLVRKNGADQVASASAPAELTALVDWASRAADQAQTRRRAERLGDSGPGEAWRLLSDADARKSRSLEGPVRVAPGAPAATSSSPRSFGAGAAATESRQSSTRAIELDRLKAARDADQAPRVRVLFRFRPAVESATAVPAEE